MSTSDWEAAANLADKIVRKANEVLDDLNKRDDPPDSGIDFASGIADRAEDMGEKIRERQTVTPAQVRALENMNAGISRWLH